MNDLDSDSVGPAAAARGGSAAFLALIQLGPETRFLAWFAGLVELLTGLTMLLLPFLFDSVVFDTLRPRLIPVGLIVSAAGLLLLVWQILPLQHTRIPQLSLLLGGAIFLAWAVGSKNWTSSIFGTALGVVTILAGLGAESRLPTRVGKNFFGAALAAGLAVAGVLLLSGGGLQGSMYRNIPPQSSGWGMAMLLAGALVAVWVRNPQRRLNRAFPVLAGLLLWTWTSRFAVPSGTTIAVLAGSLAGLAAIARPFLPDRFFVAPASRLVNLLVGVSTLLVGIALVLLVVVLLQQTEAAYQERAQRDLSTTASLLGNDSAAMLQNQFRLATIMSHDSDVLSFDPAR